MPDPAPRLDERFLRAPIAHRGLHDASEGMIENSMRAFEAAIHAGYGIELDVQMTADGEAMAFHDYDLSRLTGVTGTVQSTNLTDMRKLTLGGGPEHVPTMEAVLDLVAGRVALLIEVKDQDGALGSNVGPLERRLVTLLEKYNGPVAVMSFNPHSVQAFAEAAPHIPRGRVTCAFDEWAGVAETRLAELRPVTKYDAGGISFISHDRADLSALPVADAREAGLDILCWTVKSVHEEREARKIAQNITFEGYAAALEPAA